MTVAGTVLVVNPSADLYGADLQMLETVRGLVDDGWLVDVALPHAGELVGRVEEAGGHPVLLEYPVLRRSYARPSALVALLVEVVTALPRMLRLIGKAKPSLVLVNTLTLPWWTLASRLRRVPVVVHLHEAESEGSRLFRKVLFAPLLLAHAVVVISSAALGAMTAVQPRLRSRAHLIYNGVAGPPEVPSPPQQRQPHRLALVGRLSPRKAPHVALEALGLLVGRGYDVVLEVAGTTFPGNEWYESDLRARAEQPDLVGRVTWSGYQSPIWPVLDRADIVVAPSLAEALGNAVIEAQLAARPVIATAIQGHLETITDGETGLLVEPAEPEALARAVARLIDDHELADELGHRARELSARRFSTSRYRRELSELVDVVAQEPAALP